MNFHFFLKGNSDMLEFINSNISHHYQNDDIPEDEYNDEFFKVLLEEKR